jgi:hypothetical protein
LQLPRIHTPRISQHPAVAAEIVRRADLLVDLLHSELAAQYTEHPDTGVTFGGRQVPHLGGARELVLRAAALFPAIPLVGWDIAILPDRPILIEGNHNDSVSAMEVASGGYRVHPVFRRALNRRS